MPTRPGVEVSGASSARSFYSVRQPSFFVLYATRDARGHGGSRRLARDDVEKAYKSFAKSMQI